MAQVSKTFSRHSGDLNDSSIPTKTAPLLKTAYTPAYFGVFLGLKTRPRRPAVLSHLFRPNQTGGTPGGSTGGPLQTPVPSVSRIELDLPVATQGQQLTAPPGLANTSLLRKREPVQAHTNNDIMEIKDRIESYVYN